MMWHGDCSHASAEALQPQVSGVSRGKVSRVAGPDNPTETAVQGISRVDPRRRMPQRYH